MTDIRIDTDVAVATAGELETINNSINNAFETVINSVNSLRNSWDSPAGANAQSRFAALKEACSVTRFNVMKNYYTLLLNAVGLGYEAVENENISLASQFK